jgi:ParB-like chromosome segregation protein Spo0J
MTKGTYQANRERSKGKQLSPGLGHEDIGRIEDPGKMKKSRLRAVSERGPDQLKTMVISQIKTHPTFVHLLPVDEDLLEKMIQDMRANGYYESEPIVLGVWPGQEEPVLIDGHMRIRAASEVGIGQVPSVTVEFAYELDALQHAINLQTVRRISTDAAFYRLCEQYDRLMEPGRKGKETKELLTRVSNFVGRSASARRTAALIGCHYRKVDKIRKIRRDGTSEIQDAVRNDQLTINKAYKLIRDMELGEDQEKSRRKLSKAQVNVVKSVLSEENFAHLEAMGDDLGALLNLAVEQFIRGLRSRERAGAVRAEGIEQ